MTGLAKKKHSDSAPVGAASLFDSDRFDHAAFLAMFEGLDLGVMVLDADDRIVMCNRWMLDRLAASEHAVIGTQLTRLFPELGGSPLCHAVTKAVELGIPTHLSRDLHPSLLPLFDTKSGALEPPRLHQDITVSPIAVTDGPACCLVQVRDVSGDHSREQALRRNEYRYRTILQDQTEFVLRFQPDGTVTFANDACTSYFGMDPGDLRGRAVFDFIADGQREAFRERLEALTPASPTGDLEQVVVDTHGSNCWRLWQIRGLFNASGQVLEYQCVGLDITERKRAQLALEESESRFRELVEGSMQGIVIYRDLRPLFCNPAYARMFGYDDAAAVLQQHSVEAHVPEDAREALRQTLAAVQSGERRSVVDFGERIRKDGKHIWVQYQARRILWNGEPTAQVTLIDVTEQKASRDKLEASRLDLERQASALADLADNLERAKREAEDQRKRAEEANRAKSLFLAAMSHELRTPLNAILGFAQIMRDQVFGPLGEDRYVEYARDIHDSGEHLLRLINDVLDISKIEAGKLELEPVDFDLSALLESTVRVVRVRAESAKVELNLSLPADPLLLFADERAAKQIIYNLLSNAIKFTPKRGKVTLAADLTPTGWLELRVEDTGIGISPEDLERVLRPFEQGDNRFNRATGGTGLGLPLVNGLVDMHGGHLEIDSEPEAGTCVIVRFPPERVRVLDFAEEAAQ